MSYIADWDSGQPNALWDVGLQWDVNIGPPVGDVVPYLNLVTSEHRGQPDYIAMLSATFQPFADLQVVMGGIPGLYDIDVAVGSQEDAVGQWIGVTRNLQEPITGVYFTLDSATLGLDQGVLQGPFDPSTGIVQLPDDTYRMLLYAKRLNNSWDGTITAAYAIWDTLFNNTTNTSNATFLIDATINYFNGVTYGSSASLVTALINAGLTFSRSSPATYTNSSGLLATASNNVLRFDYSSNGTPLGILREGISTNLFPYGSALTSATAVYLTATGGQLAPDGSTNAVKFVATSDNNDHIVEATLLSLSASTTYTWSTYVKYSGYRYFTLGLDAGGNFGTPNTSACFDLQLGTINSVGANATASISVGPNGSFRVTVTATSGSGSPIGLGWYGAGATATLSYPSFVGDTVSGFIAWGSQYEALGFASSYIPTTTAAVTRVADSLSLPWTSATATFVLNTFGVNALGSQSRLLANAANGNDTPLSCTSTTPTVDAYDSPLNAFLGSSSFAPGTWAGNVSSAIAGSPTSRAITANGVVPTTDTNPLFGTTPNGIEFFTGGGQADAYGHIQQLGAWTSQMSASELQTLTTGGLTALIAAWQFTGILIQDLGGMHMLFALTGTPPSPLLLELYFSGDLNVVPAGVQADYYMTPDSNEDPYFGLDVENSVIAGLDVGGFGFLNNGSGY